ncbi:MAG TPA: hypothetical protein VFV72_16750 [Candidatus Limnocylindrales bacterium]|nr:hypothetical protein [Candidatus Limnocylindrales bacterium]
MHTSVIREVSAARRDLTLIVVVIVGLARLLDGPLLWLVAGLLLAATLVGALQVLGQLDGPAAEHGVPVESLILPAVAAIGCLGAIDLIPIGIWLVPALAATAFLVDRTLRLEERIVASDRGLTEDDRSEILVATLLVAFVAFAGAATLVPGGIAGGFGQPVPQLALSDLALLAAADALIAGLLGYRAAALRVTSVRDALWSAATYAIAIAIAAAAIRAMEIPRLIGPALLTLTFYLWDAFHGTAPSRRRDPRWIWQTGLLLALGAVVLGWNLLVRG